ncbi:hypothetical protein A0E62_gp04 [Pyrobaculum filamentous virus 1]|uniref:Uncharacterized protein n=1 Tax=Pyrobaculum filamentous virus 1 TaxID=1805492 RepID=A0A140F3J0_PFV1|nr:hypothetical protein A0E62_gp04 [Pyrobaculum filamentous virus 1]AML61150.1 hypothetical protein [Pyrobaculum filamentous virus 1]
MVDSQVPMIDEPLEAPSVSCEELMEMCMRDGVCGVRTMKHYVVRTYDKGTDC